MIGECVADDEAAESNLAEQVQGLVRDALGKLFGDGTLQVSEGEEPEYDGTEGTGDPKSPRVLEAEMEGKVRRAVEGITINVNSPSEKKEDKVPVEAGPPGKPSFLRRFVGLAD